MDIRVLGCSGGIGGAGGTTALLVDADVLIDCGTAVAGLDFAALCHIDHVFLTHSHLDHVACLPLLADAVGEQRTRPITVYGAAETLQILRTHLFNGLIWPDFTALPRAPHPYLRLQPVAAGDCVQLGTRRVHVLPALHSVPALGYVLESGQGGRLAFTGDTVACEPLLAALDALAPRHLLIEAALPDAGEQLARQARHLTPRALGALLARLHFRPEVHVTHFKPAHAAVLEAEVRACCPQLDVRALRAGQQFVI